MHTHFERVVGLMQDDSEAQRALTCEQPARTKRYSAVSSSTWPCSLRYRAAYRSRCCVESCTFTSGCFAKQQTKWYRGDLSADAL